MKTKLPSFIVTLATFLMLTGLNLGLTRMIGGGVSSPSISDMDGFDISPGSICIVRELGRS